MKKMWEIKQEFIGDTEQIDFNRQEINLYIYGDVEGDYYDWYTDEFTRSETSANAFREELTKYPSLAQINLYINSYGGSVFEGTAIYNQLKRHPAKKVVHIDGFACSIASVIAMAGDEVIMPKNAMMMIHNAWMLACGNASELRKAADDLEQINKGGRQAYLLKAGEKLSEDELVRLMDAETWLTAEDCLRLGLADRYADEAADMSLAEGIMQKVNLNLEQKIKMQKSLNAQLKELTKPAAQEIKQAEEKEPTLFEKLNKILGGM